MRSELTLVFEENDGTLHWLFSIIVYAHHISEQNVKEMLEPMLQEYLTADSYKQIMELDKKQIPEDELIAQHLHKDLVKFTPGSTVVKDEKIKALVYLIEQAGEMMKEAEGDDISPLVHDLFVGHEKVLERIKDSAEKGLERAGAVGVKIEKFSFGM